MTVNQEMFPLSPNARPPGNHGNGERERPDLPEAVSHYKSDDDDEFAEPLVATVNRVESLVLCLRRHLGASVPKAAVSDYISDDNYDGNEFPEQLVETTNRIEIRVQTFKAKVEVKRKVEPRVKVKVEPG
jgi:hypothetical protein